MTSQHPLDAAALLSDQRWLAGLARGLVGDEEAVEDVLQETRLQVWRHPPADASRTGGWLRRIASNVALRMRSSEAARRLREDAVASPERIVATDELVARVEMQRAVAEAVIRLGEPYRATVLLRFFDDLPPREIAKRLGVPVETVRTRLKRGLAQLRGQLDRKYGARDAWSAMLAPGLAWSGGVAAMSAASKVVAAAAAVLVLGIATWRIVAWAKEPDARSEHVATGPAIEAMPGPEQGRPLPASTDPSPNAAVGRTSVVPASAGILFERVRLVGRVLDGETRAPVAGARVRLRYYGRSVELVEVDARSQDDGSFEVIAKDVTRSVYLGEVDHSDYATAEITPAAMQTTPADGGLEASVGTVLLHRGTLVSGRVVMLPDRTPVAGAELFVRDPAFVAPNTFGPASAWNAGRSRADGSFELERRLVAEGGPLAILAVSNGRVGFAILRPERERDRLADFELPIEPQGALSVRVVDDQGKPVASVALTAYPTFPPLGQSDYGDQGSPRPVIAGDIWRAIFLATTDVDGRARFPALPEGRADPLFEQQLGHTQSYRVHAVAEGWPELYEGVLIARGVEATLEIKLRPPCTSLVRGRILDEGGRPITSALVRVRGFAETRTDANGYYVTESRQGPLGGVDIHVTADGFAPDDFAATRSWSRSQLVTRHDDPALPPSEELERNFTLARATTVRGHVVDEAGAPIANVAVQASGLDDARQNWVHLDATGGKTGPDGGFVIEGVSVDFLTLTIEPPEGFLEPFPTRIVPGEQNLLVTLLRAPPATARAIAAIVDSATGASLDPMDAYARPLNTSVSRVPLARCTAGQVVADTLFVGQWEMVVAVNDGRCGRARFEVTRPDETVQLKVAIGAQGIVEGVLFADGKPLLPGKNEWWAWVRPSSQNNRDSGHAIEADGRPVSGLTDGCAVFDKEGLFRVGRLPPGVPIRFVVEGKDTFADATVLLSPGETRHVEFHLRKAANVQWYQSEALPAGRLVIETGHDDDPLATLFDAATGRPGTLLTRQRMNPGRVRWRAEFTSSVEYPPRVRVASGQVDLVPGETKMVDVVGFE